MIDIVPLLSCKGHIISKNKCGLIYMYLIHSLIFAQGFIFCVFRLHDIKCAWSKFTHVYTRHTLLHLVLTIGANFTLGVNLHMSKIFYIYANAFTWHKINPGADFAHVQILYNLCKSVYKYCILHFANLRGGWIMNSRRYLDLFIMYGIYGCLLFVSFTSLGNYLCNIY